jgi:nucleoside-diphosphate-sugar epimerase
MIIELCDKKESIKPVHVKPRIGEVKQLIANASKAKKILKWEAKYELRKGLEEFIQWYRNYGQEERIKLE